MKAIQSALLLVADTDLLTFGAISLGLFPRPLTFGNPTLLVEALGIAGSAFFALGVGGRYRVHRAMAGNGSSAPSRVSAA